mgnify:CR=1 FL=1
MTLTGGEALLQPANRRSPAERPPGAAGPLPGPRHPLPDTRQRRVADCRHLLPPQLRRSEPRVLLVRQGLAGNPVRGRLFGDRDR